MLAAMVRAAAATPPPVARPDVTASRAELSEAVRQWAAAREACRLAEAAHCRAQNLVAGADGRLADFAGLDARITTWRANAIRDGRDDEPLPHDLARMQRDAGTAADRCSELRRAMMALQADAIAANATLTAADQKRATLAARVVLGEMDRIADALAAMDAKAVALRKALYSAAACYLIVPGASPPVIAISPKARDTLLREPLQLSVDHEFNRELRDWHAALMRNSEAIFGEGDTDAGDRNLTAVAAAAAA